MSLFEPVTEASHIELLEVRCCDRKEYLACHWQIKQLSGQAGELFCYVDVGINSVAVDDQKPIRNQVAVSLTALPSSESRQRETVEIERHELGKALQFLLNLFRKQPCTGLPSCSVVKLIVPKKSGYVQRSDFLKQRMLDCEHAGTVTGFVEPGQRVHPLDSSKKGLALLISSLNTAVGGISIMFNEGNIKQQSDQLDLDIRNRISFPWLADTPIARKRLAIVGGRRDMAVSPAAKGFLRAAENLGISLLVLDKPGHWLENSSANHLREAFLPIDTTDDGDLARRITKAIQANGVPIDGIVTFVDPFLVPVAEAAKMLGLATSPSAAFEICNDKLRTRMLDLGELQVMEVSKPVELHNYLNGNTGINYPVIVKPSGGASAQGVAKADNAEQLDTAVKRIWNGEVAQIHGSRVIIETFVSGPEVDFNVVLCDGEILFDETSDDLTCAAETGESGIAKSFCETSMPYPSILPPHEIEALREYLGNTLRKLGFRNGVFHLEARLKNSQLGYCTRNGMNELAPKDVLPATPPSPFLIEINGRAPGWMCSYAAEHVYGIDFYALSMLSALGDKCRMKALSQPFLNGASYFYEIGNIQAERSGIIYTNYQGECASSLPAYLVANVPWFHVLQRSGSAVASPESGNVTLLAVFLVYSRKSRSDAHELAEKVRGAFEYRIV